MVNNKIPFPQADDFNKVIDLLNIESPEKMKSNYYIKDYLHGVTDRQVNYYLSACMYLGFLNSSREFTKEGLKFRKENSCNQTIEILRILLGDEIFGTAYLTQKKYGYQLSYDELTVYISKYYPQYSASSLQRRARTLSSWIDWIEENLNS